LNLKISKITKIRREENSFRNICQNSTPNSEAIPLNTS
jgi:hypothetical protein